MVRIFPVTQLAVLLLLTPLSLVLAEQPSLDRSDTPVPSREPSSAELAQETAGALTLSDAIALGLSRNPQLTAFSWQIRAADARLLQAGLLPNPELGVEVEDVIGTGIFRGGRQTQTTLRLSQLIELGDKRAARRGVAVASQELASQEYEIKRVEILSDIAEKFVEVLGAQHELALTEETTQLADTFLDAARTRVRAGKASALEEKKAGIAAARNRIVREHAEHELLVARMNLAATWASRQPIFERAEGDLFEVQQVPQFETIADRLASSPERNRWISEKRLREAEVILADSKRIPDVTFGAGARRQEGPDAETFLFQFSVPLPAFNRNQGASAEARAIVQKTDAEQESASLRVHAVLFGLYQELLHAVTAIQSLEQAVLPESREALALSQQGFHEGRFSYTELLDAQRTFVEVRQEMIETGLSYHRFLLGIERLMGQPIDPTSRQH